MTDMNILLQRMEQRHAARQQLMRRNDYNATLRGKAIQTGPIPGFPYEYWIVPSPTHASFEQLAEDPDPMVREIGRKHLSQFGLYNGYVYIPRRSPAPALDLDLLTYIPVHGGITYRLRDGIGKVWGWDSSHCDSGDMPLQERNWYVWQCEILAHGLDLCRRLEKPWKRASREGRIELAQQVLDLVPEASYSFGVMMNMLRGKP